MSHNPKQLLNDIKAGHEVKDKDFDLLYPPKIRKASDVHWTEINTAKVAAEFLADTESTRVLDIGSGIGKFCLVGALTTKARFFGAELRGDLCQCTKDIILRYHIERVSIIHTDALEINWADYDAFYLFNPFYESSGDIYRIDRSIEPNKKNYLKNIAITEQRLAALPLGTKVATYFGFGGEMPPSYVRVQQDAVGIRSLDFWIKEHF